MKIQCTTAVLLKAVRDVLPAATGRSTLATLNHVLFRVEDGAASVETTDLELFMRRKYDTDACADGEAMADARLLAALLAKLPRADAVSVESVDKGGVVLKSKGRKYTLAGVPPEEFPRFPVSANDAVCLEMAGTTLGRMIGEVEHAAADPKSGRTNLQAVYLCGDTGVFRAVATDGHRLTVSTSDIECGPIKAILPVAFARTVAGAFGELPEPVRILFDAHSACFTATGLTIHARLVEGQFPNYQRVIPQQFDTGATINRQELLDAASRACLVTEDLSKKLHIDICSEGVRVFVDGVQSANEEVPVSDFSGELIETACNGDYLRECLSAYDCDTVRIRLTQSQTMSPRPMLVDRGADDADAQFTVLMPMSRNA